MDAVHLCSMSDWTPTLGFEGGRRPALPPASLQAPRGGPWKPLEIPPDPSALGLFVGTAGWHFDDWAGRFYPPRSRPARGNSQVTPSGARTDLGPRDWFPFYQLYFSFLELNHTFYQEPLLAHFLELDKRSKPGMRFSVKAHREVSHKGSWEPEEGKALMRRHAEAAAPLVDSGRFYSFLIQLDDRVERRRRVLDYLLAAGSASLKEGCDVHVEFRHRTWHQEPVLQALKDAGIGICNPEIPPLGHAFPRRFYATSAKGYVRYCGLNAGAWADRDLPRSPRERLAAMDARHDYLYTGPELEERAREQMLLLKKTGAVAVVFKNHARAQAAVNAAQNAALLSRLLKDGRFAA